MADFIVPDWPAAANVRALQTTRRGGKSAAAFSSFNLGEHVGDDPLTVAANREFLRQRVGGDICWLQQVHGTTVIETAIAMPGAVADAAVARAAGEVCAVMTADCLPVLFSDRRGSVVAAAHAGWRGLAAGILEQTVTRMGVAGSDLLVWLGPAIGPVAFEVGDEVRAAFVADDPAAASAFAAGRDDRWLADLYRLARQRLNRMGIVAVYGGDFCTFSDPGRFFSYRRDGQTGRMATLIWLESSMPAESL